MKNKILILILSFTLIILAFNYTIVKKEKDKYYDLWIRESAHNRICRASLKQANLNIKKAKSYTSLSFEEMEYALTKLKIVESYDE